MHRGCVGVWLPWELPSHLLSNVFIGRHRPDPGIFEVNSSP